MILIGENIHVISKQVREALVYRDENFILNLIQMQKNMNYIDLNVGPAKNELIGILPWLCKLVEDNSNLNISFDTTNIEEMEKGLKSFRGKTFLNSTSKEEPKLSKMIDMSLKYNSNLIALTMNEDGIPKTSDERLEIAFEIYEKCLENGIKAENLFFDPLVLPVCADQSQGIEALNTIKMIKESFEPQAKTVIGLSNISNGAMQRPVLNRTFAALAHGAGLDAAIIDAKDLELIRIIKMLEEEKPEFERDCVYLRLANMMKNFEEIENVEFDKKSVEQNQIIKAAMVLLNREVYSHSFTQI